MMLCSPAQSCRLMRFTGKNNEAPMVSIGEVAWLLDRPHGQSKLRLRTRIDESASAMSRRSAEWFESPPMARRRS